MKEALLNTKEQIKNETIKEIVVHNGNKRKASVKLGIFRECQANCVSFLN